MGRVTAVSRVPRAGAVIRWRRGNITSGVVHLRRRRRHVSRVLRGRTGGRQVPSGWLLDTIDRTYFSPVWIGARYVFISLPVASFVNAVSHAVNGGDHRALLSPSHLDRFTKWPAAKGRFKARRKGARVEWLGHVALKISHHILNAVYCLKRVFTPVRRRALTVRWATIVAEHPVEQVERIRKEEILKGI